MKKENLINFIKGMSIIFIIQYFCTFLLKFLKISFPAPILGIILLFVLLKTNIVKEKDIKLFCEFILKYMILFFIPLFVGITTYLDVISQNFLAIMMTIFLTTTFVIVLVGVFVENLIKFNRFLRFKKRKKECWWIIVSVFSLH